MLRPVTVRDEYDEAGVHERRRQVRRSSRGSTVNTTARAAADAEQLVELDSHHVRRLLDDFAPLEEDPDSLPAAEASSDDNGARAASEGGYRRAQSEPQRDLDLPSFAMTSKSGLLTPAQEVLLARRIEAGDRRAKEILIQSNIRLVASIAQKYQNRGLPIEDLIQDGIIGLIRAVDKFNWRRGYRFSTYATHWIKQTILRAIANSGRSIRLPAYIVDAVGRVARLRSQLENTLGRQPTRSELAHAACMPEAQLVRLLQSIVDPVSLDAPLGDEGDRRLAEVLPSSEEESPTAHAFRHAVNEEVARALKSLSPREQSVITLRYGLDGNEPHTLDGVGKQLKITRERARQLEMQALEKLRAGEAGAELKETLEL